MYDGDKKRYTGRSTRMLKEAIRLSGKGYAVYVMGSDTRHAKLLELMLEGLNPLEHHGIKFECPESLPHFDWRTMTLANTWPNVKVLVDHWVIENRYRYMLDMLYQFDSIEKEDEDGHRD
jgi:hypothetical protein